MFPEKTDNRPLKLVCFLLPIKVSREFDLWLCINYAYVCRWIRNLKETFLWSIITWPTLGKQNIQFQVVCWEIVLSSTDLIHLRKRQRYVMHNVYLNSPFVVMGESKLKFGSLSGHDRYFRYLTIFSFLLSFKILTHMRRKTDLGPVLRTRVSSNPGLNFNPGFFFFLSKAFSRIVFSILFRVSNYQIVGKEN